MSPDTEQKLAVLYATYNSSVKLLIADIEARTQKFPVEILNEVRAFTDHIARCYLPGKTEAQQLEEIEKADGHIVRITLDCYKHLNVHLYDAIDEFAKRDMQNVDLSFIDNGSFFIEFRRLRREAKSLSRDARKNESQDKQLSLQLYEQMYNKYNEIEEYIEVNSHKLGWAKMKFFKNRRKAIGVWIATLIASGAISWVVATLHERTKHQPNTELQASPPSAPTNE